MGEKRLFLLDAYALIFRAYYALIRMPRLTQGGFNTSAIFGFVNTLEELLKKERPTHLAVCFDPPGPTFRNEAYEGYKADREATPEDIKLSIPIIKEIVKAYRIPIIEKEGYEADDVIGTLAKKAEKEGVTTYMMTPDKDYGQLVSPHILQYKPSYRGQDFELRGEKEVCERSGIERTSQVIDLLALMGDKVDNIPGCPGVGEKTATKLISEYGSVEELLDRTDTLKGALKKKIEENADQIRFSKFLATIKTDVPVELDLKSLEVEVPDREKLFSIFKELEFRTLTDRVARRLNSEEREEEREEREGKGKERERFAAQPSLFDFAEEGKQSAEAEERNEEGQPEEARQIEADYITVDNGARLGELRRELDGKREIGLYLHGEGENDMSAEWTGTAIATEAGKAYWIPTDYAEGKALVLDLMALPDIKKISGGAKRDYVLAQRARKDDTEALQNYYDVTLAHYLLQPEMRHNLEILASTYLNLIASPYPGTAKGGKKKGDVVTLEQQAAWGCEQADLALRLKAPLDKAIEKEGMRKLLEDIELPLVRVLAEMELTGVTLDVKALDEAAKEMEGRIDQIEREIHELAGTDFNVGSPAKVGEILFDKLGLDPKAKKTKTGQYSTSEEVLEKLSPKHPIVGKILEYRAMKKLLNTYLTALPAAINPETGKIHTNYNQTVTATGRISSTAPNLQNIPVRDVEGREIRRAFMADPGCLFLSADYSQIELRLMADFSSDEIMLDAFRHGKDIHAITAGKIFHKPTEEVSANERRAAKTANFGIIYGISAFGLATRLGIPRGEAKEIIDNYFATFPTIKKYMSDSVEFAREHGYVETKSGRKRILPDINSRNPVVRGYAERNAMNAPLQGTAADVIKIAMVRIYDEIKERGLRSRMIMQIHDELNFNVIPEELPELQEIVERQMEGAYRGSVTLTASSGTGRNWLEAH